MSDILTANYVQQILLPAGGLFLFLLAIAGLGYLIRKLRDRRRRSIQTADKSGGGQEAYIVSAMLGLLALLLGFTFSLSVTRYEKRHELVIQEANAIGTAYFRANLLPEPHRQRISAILVNYVDNRLKLATEIPGPQRERHLEANDRMLTEIWAATAAAYEDAVPPPFAASFVQSINGVMDFDTSRKAARRTNVPDEVFTILLLYMTVTAATLGYVMRGMHNLGSTAILLLLLTLSLVLSIDIDQPVIGGIRESQDAMEMLQRDLHSRQPEAFDRWRSPANPRM